MSEKNEKLGTEIIRKFFNLEIRPQVSQAVEDIYKKMTSTDKTREVDAKTQDLDKPLD